MDIFCLSLAAMEISMLISMAARDKQNISIRFIRVCEYFDAGKLFVDQHLSVETYYRLIIPEIMPGLLQDPLSGL